MLYEIGDKIFYPMHGAGIIESIEENEILGEVRKYYVLKMPLGTMKLMVPVNNAEELGLRDVADSGVMPKVIDHIEIHRSQTNINWNKRQRENLAKLRSGDIFEAADVYKFLICREKDRSLSTGEKKMLLSAKQILFSELLLSTGIELDELQDLIDQAIS
ncbi:MAG: CarD family transcriptional regulator [Clostridiales bacterium]|nr:CarD family transcriptional regulator [Clostridiales bacterium]